MKRAPFAFFGFLAFAALTSPAKADDTIAAEAAFAEARTLMAEGRYAEACPKLEISYKLDPALGALMNLAECRRKTARTATAWLLYREVASTAHRQGQVEREQVARDHAKQLEPFLCRLVLRASDAPEVPGLITRRDGTPVESALYGVAVPVDPGPHEVTFSAPGYRDAVTRVEVTPPAEGAPCPDRVIVVPPLEPSPALTSAPPPRVAVAPTHPPPEGPRRWTALDTLSVVFASAGVASVGVGAGFGVSASSIKGEADATCIASGCSADGLARRHDAGRAADVATVLVAAGAASLATGLLLFALSPSRRAPVATSIRF